MTSLSSGVGIARLRRAVAAGRSDRNHTGMPILLELCLSTAGGAFLAAALLAVLFLTVGSRQPEVVGLVGLTAFGLTMCVPTVFYLASKPSAAPVPPVPQPAAPVRVESPAPEVPEPPWQRLEPLPDDGSPLQAQIARRLDEAIDAGRFPPGAAMPSDQQLARLFKVSPGTVRRAKTLARTWGYLRKESGGEFIVAVRSRPLVAGVAP